MTRSSKLDAFEAKQKAVFEKYKELLECPKCEGPVGSKGNAGNAVGGVRRLYLKCKDSDCGASQAFHIALPLIQNTSKDITALEAAYKAAIAEGKIALDMIPKTPLAGVKRLRRTIDSPLGAILYTEFQENEQVDKPSEAGQDEGIDCNAAAELVDVVSLDDLHTRLAAKDEVIESMKRVQAEQADRIAALEFQLQELLGQHKADSGQSVPKHPTMAQSKPQRPPPPRASVSEAKADTPLKRTYKNVAATGVKPKPSSQPTQTLPAKEIRELRKYVSPYQGPPKIEALCFVWNADKRSPVDRKAEFSKVWRVLAAIKVKSLVKDVSFIGRSLVQLFVEEKNVVKVKEAMAAFARADTFVPAEKVDSFSLGKVSGDNLRSKIELRCVVLLARNPAKNMQDCILRSITSERRVALVAKAAELREQWQSAAAKSKEPVAPDTHSQ
jgi:uncharacterized coiled-coil protein SlyX